MWDPPPPHELSPALPVPPEPSPHASVFATAATGAFPPPRSQRRHVVNEVLRAVGAAGPENCREVVEGRGTRGSGSWMSSVGGFFFVYSLRVNLSPGLLTAGVRMRMQGSKSIRRLDRWGSWHLCCTRHSKTSRSCSKGAIRCAAAGAPAQPGLAREHTLWSFAMSRRGAESCACGRKHRPCFRGGL